MTTPRTPSHREDNIPVASQRVLSGRYELGGLIGRGGMADVHRGLDTRLGRTVAIKLLRPDLARDPQFQARFKREAQAVAALNHPSIVAIYDTGEHTGRGRLRGQVRVPYIVMEFVAGKTLRDLIRAREVTIDQAVEFTLGVLSALEYSHKAGIVHRDIKPANVMYCEGMVKVMDFGIARAMADSSATMTQTQAVVGTAQYLSPEQARGEAVDARSDLYSAGCLLYETLTGRPPFVGESPVSVAYQHVRENRNQPATSIRRSPERWTACWKRRCRRTVLTVSRTRRPSAVRCGPLRTGSPFRHCLQAKRRRTLMTFLSRTARRPLKRFP